MSVHYIIATDGGTEIGFAPWNTLEAAVEAARRRLEDDPEFRSLDVYAVDHVGNWTHERTVTFGPDANWESVVVVLEPGQKIEPPAGSYLPRQLTEEDLDAYDLGDAKRITLQRMMDEGQWV